MVSNDQPDCLPSGSNTTTKLKNGPKFKYIKDGCISNEKGQQIDEHTRKSSEEKNMEVVDANEYEWLPTGWAVERKWRKTGVRVGMEYKIFIDPSTGSKFFSKPEVLRYLGSKQCNTGLSNGNDKERSGHSSVMKSVETLNADKSNLEAKVSQISKTRVRKSLTSGKLKVVVEKTVDEELPSGWIKETRIKMRGNKIVRKDPFFADPVSRLVFRSKLEVLRYVKTGEISRHAYRRREGMITGEDIAITISSCGEEDTRKRKTTKPLGITTQTPPTLHDDDTKEASPISSEPSSLPSSDVSTNNNPLDGVHDYNNKKIPTTKRKIKDGKSPCVPSRTSKRLAGVDTEVLYLQIPIERVLRVTKKPSRTRPKNEKQENHKDVDGNDSNKGVVKATRRTKSYRTKRSPSLKSQKSQDSNTKVNESTSQEVNHQTIDYNEKIMLAIDGLKTKKSILVDLNDLQLGAPPGFSEKQKILPSSITMNNQSLEQSQEQIPSTENPAQQPESLWSDPCLEFAYKTLTGAIPFDDNLAIEDYIQHQLRTSDPNPDICAPNLFGND